MHKRLDLQIIRNMRPDLFDLCHRELPRGNDPLRSQLIPEAVRLIICIICLCADMAFNFRTDALCDRKYTWVCDDQSIRPNLFQFLKIGFHACEVAIVRENIRRHIYLYAMLVCKGNALLHILHRKIFRLGAQTECLAANVYRICAKHHCGLQYLQAARRD